MDQLKDILAILKKYHFWILCGLIALLYLGTWFKATSDVKQETSQRVSKINSDYSTAQNIKSIVSTI